MAGHACLKNEFTQGKKCQNLMGWLKYPPFLCITLYFQDYDKLASFVANNYNTKLEKVDLSVKGWNWGITKFEGMAGILLTTNLLVRDQ